MNLVATSILQIFFLCAGLIIPYISEKIAATTTKQTISHAQQPKAFLRAFYRSRSLKVTLQTIFMLIFAQCAPLYFVHILLGMISGTIYQKLTFYKNPHEQKPSYIH